MFTEDPGIFLADFGKPVVAGATTGLGIMEQNAELILGGEMSTMEYVLIALTSVFGTLAYGQTITVDGQAYKVEGRPMPFDDGTFCRVFLNIVEGVIVASLLLMEDGFILLAENNDRLALES